MGMPAVLSQTGTGTVFWNPDWFQDPFQVGVQVVPSSTGTATVDYTLDDINGPLGTANAHWNNLLTFNTTATFTAVNFTTPCQWMRLSVSAGVATSVFTATFVQAQFPR
jgi:hypothetical protein